MFGNLWSVFNIFSFDTRSLLLFATVFLLFYWRINKPKFLPPVPFNWPLVGSFPTFAWHGYGLQLHEVFTKLGKKYGNIYYLKTFGSHMIVISDYQLLKEAFNNPKINNKFQDNLRDEIFGLARIAFEDFKPYRRFAMTTFRHFGVGKQSFENKVMTESEILRQEIMKLNGASTELHGLLNNATANVICSVVFGQRYDYNDTNFKHLIHLSNRFNDLIGAGGSEDTLPIFASLPIQSKAKREMKEIADMLRAFLTDIVEDHRRNYNEGNINDFVDAYLCKQMRHNNNDSSFIDPHSFLTDDNMLGSLLDLFIAGADTTSFVVYWGILFLVKNPEIQRKIQTELDQVVGRHRFPSVSDKPKLSYTRAVIQEIFRMASPVPLGVMHVAGEDTTIGPYNVPEGTTVVPNIWAIHHDPRLWKNPREFRPQRFLANGDNIAKVLPFGVGRRSCPGEALAQVMVFMFFTHLLHQFRFVIPKRSSSPSLRGYLGIVYKPEPFSVCSLTRN